VALLEFNEQTCNQCGICAAICPMAIIDSQKDSYPRLSPQAAGLCLRCGHCVAVCPSDSLIHKEIPLEQSPNIDRSLDITYEQCAQLIRSRRSVREFKDKQVPAKEIERIIDVARYAPTGGNRQEVQWLVISDPAKVKELSVIGTDWLRWEVENNPAYGPYMQRLLKRQESGNDIFLRNAPAVVVAFAEKSIPTAATDCSVALAYFDLVACSAGLGCCWAGFLMRASLVFPPMVAALALPDGYAPYGSLMLGYPKYKYRRMPARKPARIIYAK
jgi:nitroreductase/Pyruvate/2-oxoacid:ferredoxin oxidoreductase delta subunit